MTKVGFFVAGLKGYDFFQALCEKCNPAFVVSYEVKGTLDDSFSLIKKSAKIKI